MMKVSHLDHLVLTVRDINRTLDFYIEVLGFTKKVFNQNRVALHFGNQKINLHSINKPIDKNVRHAHCGSSDLCFITESSMNEIIDHLDKTSVEVIEGPIVRTGANGPINSVYFYDPDENLIELSTYKK